MASQSLYSSVSVNITIEVVLKDNLQAAEYPSIVDVWNDNFTIHLNYTQQDSMAGIVHSNISVSWNDAYTIQEIGGGMYNINCSNRFSACQYIKYYRNFRQ